MGSITACVAGDADIRASLPPPNIAVTLIGELFNRDTRMLMALLEMSGVDYEF